MLINSQLVLDVLNAWVSDQDHPHRGRSAKPIPPEQDFAVLLNTMFQLSLLREEGRPVLMSVTWVSMKEFEDCEVGRMRESRLTLEFHSPLAFEAYNVIKLSGIVNGKTGALLVANSDSGPQVWGVCYFIGRTGALGEIPAGDMRVRHLSPDYPTVTITGAGSMDITRSDSVIGRIESGKFLRPQPTVLTSHMLGQYLYRLIDIEIDFRRKTFKNEQESAVARVFFHCIEFIIEVLSQRRVGATVIFVHPRQIDDAPKSAHSPWSVRGSLEIALLQNARLEYSERASKTRNIAHHLHRLKIDQALRQRLRSLIDLTAIDGALLLSPSFDVIGFGMKLAAPKWEKSIEHGPVEGEKQLVDFSRLGTRHNPALNFIGTIGGAVAFVASSDGPIRALVKSTDEKVWYWPDSRISMFAK